MIIGKKRFETGHTYIMGILNVTPDSFSDGGKFNTVDNALLHIEEMISDGADVIDIGGESTRPGFTRISVEEETERTAKIIERAKESFDIPISIDTYKPEVALEAVKRGADLVNDIWGLKGENLLTPQSGMAQVISRTGVSCCIMHNRNLTDQENRASLVAKELKESLKIALEAGIEKDRILLDPGIGFGKTYEENIDILKGLKELTASFDYPFLLGSSRKSVIGLTLGLPSGERMEGTLATTARAVDAGCLFVRVHDVKENARFIKMYEAIVR